MSVGDFFSQLPGTEQLTLSDAYCDMGLALLVCYGRLHGVEEFHNSVALNRYMRSKTGSPDDWDEYARHCLTYGEVIEGFLQRPLKGVQEAGHHYRFFMKYGVTLSGQMLWDFVLIDYASWPKELPSSFQSLCRSKWETHDYMHMVHLYENVSEECFRLAMFCAIKGFRVAYPRPEKMFTFSADENANVYSVFKGNGFDTNYKVYRNLVNAFMTINGDIQCYRVNTTRSMRKRHRGETLVPRDIVNRIWTYTALERTNNHQRRWINATIHWMGTLIFHIKTKSMEPERAQAALIVLNDE